MQDFHEREPPMQLFSVMVRGITAAAVLAAFAGMPVPSLHCYQLHGLPGHSVYTIAHA